MSSYIRVLRFAWSLQEMEERWLGGGGRFLPLRARRVTATVGFRSAYWATPHLQQLIGYEYDLYISQASARLSSFSFV